MNISVKIGLSIMAIALYTFSTSYTANPNAPLVAYLASGAGAVGAYMLGLFQVKPGELK